MTELEDLEAKQLSADDIRALFPGAWWHEVFEYWRDPPPPIHFVDRSLSIDGMYMQGPAPWALVVHGDLHATGDLDFWTSDYKVSLLVVQGNVRCRNFRFTNGATCVIAQDLVASDFVFGRYGDESARLEVGGKLSARALLLDHVTGVTAHELDAIVCCSDGWGLPIDIRYEADNRGVFSADVLDTDGTIDLDLAWAEANAGNLVLLPDAETRLRRH